LTLILCRLPPVPSPSAASDSPDFTSWSLSILFRRVSTQHDERVGNGVPLLDSVFDHEALHPDVLVLADAMSAVVRLRFRGSIPAVRNRINEGGTERVGNDTSGPCYRRPGK
jgi:hypothetical protein